MTTEAQRIAIAAACGIAYPQWECTNPECAEFGIIAEGRIVRSGRSLYCPGSQCGNDLSLIALPDYLNDLNAMHEAEKVLNQAQCFEYRKLLQEAVLKPVALASTDFLYGATAAQRAEAFLRTIGKWSENPA